MATNKKILRVVTSAFVFFSLIVVGSLVHSVRRFIYPTDRIYHGTKLSQLISEIRDVLLKNDDIIPVSFDTEDNVHLSGLFFQRQNPQATLIACHGHRCSKEFMYRIVDLFPKWNILLFDFRAHGQSGGKITSVGYHEYKDVIAASRFLRHLKLAQTAKAVPLIILGVSMGGAAALRAAEKEPNLCDVIIVDSTFSSLNKALMGAFSAYRSVPYYPFFPALIHLVNYFADCNIYEMNPIESVETIKQPILFIHSCTDEYISPMHAVELFAHARNRKSKIWIGPRCRHALLHTYYPELYQKKVLKFCQRVLH